MLQAIRDRATGWIAWAIIILISIPFALWGINEYFSPGHDVAVATVGGEPIDYRELQRAVAQQRTRVRAALGTSVDDAIIREAALDGLINDRVLLLAAVDGGMRVGDEQLARSIRNEPAFSDENGFSQARYELALAQQGMTPQGYEQVLRTNLLTGQLSQVVAASSVVPLAVRQEAARLQLQTRTVRTLRFDAAADADADEDSGDEALAAYYDEHKADFRTPPTVNFEYVVLDRDAIGEEVHIAEAALQAAYERDKANFTQSERREVRHILIEADEEADDAAVAEAKAEIEAIRAEIEAGAEFAEVAKEKSQDIGSAGEGGSLGVIDKDVFDPAFEVVAFAAAEGELSEPVRTPFGWHLIMVDSITPETTKPFEDMREQLETEARLNESDGIFYEQLDRLSTLGFENPESLDRVSSELGLTVLTSEFVSAEGLTPDQEALEGAVGDQAVLAAAFSELRDVGTVSEAIEVGDSSVVMLRVLERRPETDRPLDEIKDVVRTAMLAARRIERARESGVAALAALRDGAAAADVAEEHAAQWSEARDDARRDAELDGAVVDTLFKMPPPADDKPVYDAIEIGTEAFVVVELAKVDNSAADSLSEDGAGAEGRMLAQLLQRSVGTAELRAFAVALRDAADVQIIDVSGAEFGAY